MQQYRTYLVDESAALRRGLAELLGHEHGFEIVGSEAPDDGTVARIIRAEPDVAILNVGVDRSGIARCIQIRRAAPGTKCVLFTANPTDDIRVEAIAAGAHGFMAKHLRGGDIVQLLRRIAEGHLVYSDDGDSP